MIFNWLKTAVLLGSLSALLLLLGSYMGGTHGLTIALAIALIFNFITYFYSDKIVLRMYKAQPLNKQKFAHIYAIVEELCEQAHLPMPQLWYIPTSMANAFATGRNPKHASVAVTQGILDVLNESELRGVLAHEISHVKNRDILIGTIAATMATAIGYLAHMMRWSVILGGRSRDRGNGIGALLVALLMPIAAMMIQMAISRSREYLADESGARCCHDPLALASALEKLDDAARAQRRAPESPAQATVASLFIVYPFSGRGLMSWFSTHPPMAQRIARLQRMAERY